MQLSRWLLAMPLVACAHGHAPTPAPSDARAMEMVPDASLSWSEASDASVSPWWSQPNPCDGGWLAFYSTEDRRCYSDFDEYMRAHPERYGKVVTVPSIPPPPVPDPLCTTTYLNPDAPLTEDYRNRDYMESCTYRDGGTTLTTYLHRLGVEPPRHDAGTFETAHGRAL